MQKLTNPAKHSLLLRPAKLSDINALLQLEEACFVSDRLKARNFKWLIEKGNTRFNLIETNTPKGKQLVAYLLLLFRRKSQAARIYSIAVNPTLHGQGVGKFLMQQAEVFALAAGCSTLKLEVRPDNLKALALYKQLGYEEFGKLVNFYEDLSPALRLQKHIAN